jgi:hypothetical protein
MRLRGRWAWKIWRCPSTTHWMHWLCWHLMFFSLQIIRKIILVSLLCDDVEAWAVHTLLRLRAWDPIYSSRCALHEAQIYPSKLNHFCTMLGRNPRVILHSPLISNVTWHRPTYLIWYTITICQVLEEAKQKIPEELRQLAESGGGSGGRRDGGRRDEGYANRWWRKKRKLTMKILTRNLEFSLSYLVPFCFSFAYCKIFVIQKFSNTQLNSFIQCSLRDSPTTLVSPDKIICKVRNW